MPRGLDQDVGTFVPDISTFVAGQHHRLQRDPISLGSGCDAHRVPDGAAAELEDHVLAEVVQKLMHLSCMNSPRGHRHHTMQSGPVLLEENSAL